MSGPNRPGDIPPDLPPEYAEAYRRGFENAYAERPGEQAAPRHAESDMPYPIGDLDDERRRWVVPAILAGLALALILSAYGLGKLFSSGVSDTDATSPEPADGVVLGEESTTSDAPKKPKGKQQKPYDGEVRTVEVGGADASCTAAPSVDAAGKKVSYAVKKAYDGDTSTAWRCEGSGVGEEVSIDFPEETTVVELGLIPGYAKTDPVNGADRYAENNRITRVRWVFDDGTVITQKLDGSAENRSMQTMRIPETEASSVTIDIRSSTEGPRDTVAISEVAIGEAAS